MEVDDVSATLQTRRCCPNVIAKSQDRGADLSRKKKTFILQGISFVVQKGTMLAIIGPTGSGKTTLLNIMANQIDSSILDVSGSLRDAGGQSITKKWFRSNCGFVPQDNVLLPTLTPRESIMFACSLRLGRSLTHSQKQKHASKILQNLGLDRCADVRIGDELLRGISGGEKKRTSIGVELVTRPSMLFLDEPTTGLDSFTSYSVIKTLKKLHADESSSKKMCTIMSIHQPNTEIFRLFDELLILAPSPYGVLYAGPALQALDWFESLGLKPPPFTNACDFFPCGKKRDTQRVLMLKNRWSERGKSGNKLGNNDCNDDLTSSQSSKANDSEGDEASVLDDDNVSGRDSQGREAAVACKASPEVSSQCLRAFDELKMLTARSWRLYWRQPLLLVSKCLHILVIGPLIGGAFWQLENTQQGVQNRLGAIYFIVIACVFGNLLSVVLTFADERSVFLREQRSKMYSIYFYYLGKTLVEIPLAALSTVLFGIVVYGMTGMGHTMAQFIDFQVALVLVGFCGQSIGMLAAAACETRNMACIIAPALVSPFILFTPYAIRIENIPVIYRILQTLSPFWWSFQSMTVTEFAHLKLICLSDEKYSIPSESNQKLIVCPFVRGEQVMFRYGIQDSPQSIWMLLGIACLLRLLALLLMRCFSHRVMGWV